MAPRKPTRAELEAEVRTLRKQGLARSVASVVNNGIRWGGLVAISYFIFCSVDALAGETTAADIGVNFLANMKVSQGVAWIFGGGGVFYGWRQRTLRKRTIQRLQARITSLELRLDPNRTSSGLTPTGDTNPKDE